jgi:hypothetical protein
MGRCIAQDRHRSFAFHEWFSIQHTGGRLGGKKEFSRQFLLVRGQHMKRSKPAPRLEVPTRLVLKPRDAAHRIHSAADHSPYQARQ